MIFEGKIVKDNSKKNGAKIFSKAFDIVDDISKATHIKLKGINEFVEINKNLVVKRKRDVDGNPTNEEVHYSQIAKNGQEEFVCVKNGDEFAIEYDFYAQIVLMNKNENGNYLRCDDGVFVHRDEIQAPTFKKLKTSKDVKIEAPVHEREFCIEAEILTMDKDGTQIDLAEVEDKSRIRKDDDKWLYRLDNGSWEKCTYHKGLETRKYFNHVLLDGKTIVSTDNLEVKNGNRYVIKSPDGSEIDVGKREVDLKNAFVEGCVTELNSKTIISSNMEEQRNALKQSNSKLTFNWAGAQNSDGLIRVEVNPDRTRVVFTYSDGHREIYAKSSVRVKNLGTDIIYKVDKIDIIDLGDRGIKIEWAELKNEIAKDVIFKNGRLSSYTVNDVKITNIKWREVEGYGTISAYTIDGVTLSDVEWDDDNQIKSCKIHLVDENGDAVVENIRDFKNSQYKNLGITYTLTEKIEDVKIDGSTISFKMGEYKFVDAEFTDDGNIGKCKLIHKGKEQEIDLSNDNRFKQLKLAVKVSLDGNRVIPLVRSQLLQKNNGQYQLGADILQTQEMKNGIASATQLESVDQAVKEQDKFKKSPFKTLIIDSTDPNKTHTLSDFNTLYEGASEFELSNDMLPDFIGKNKYEVKKGELELDRKEINRVRDNLIVGGMGLCNISLLLLPISMCVMAVGAIYAIGAPVYISTKENKLKKFGAGKLKNQIQDNIAQNCQERINTLVAEYRRELKAYKKIYSQKEFEEKARQLRHDFRFACRKEIGKLQLLGGGAINSEFDARKKNKLNKNNYPAYQEYMRLRNELERGKQRDSRFNRVWKREVDGLGLEGDDKIDKKIEILTQYGGRKEQIKAYKLKKKHINLFLEQENAARADRGEMGISLKDYKKQLNNEFNQGRLVWGSISDKVEAFKYTPEYLKADSKTKKQLLASRKQALKKETSSIVVKQVKFEPRLDKNGNPIVGQYTQSALAYMEYVDSMFTMGDTKPKKKFTPDFYETLTNEDKEVYTPTKTLSEATVRKVSTTQNRRILFDKSKAVNAVMLIEKEQERLQGEIAKLGNKVAQMDKAGYEDLFVIESKTDAELKAIKAEHRRLEDAVKRVPHAELNVDGIKNAERALVGMSVASAKIGKRINQSKMDMQDEYRRQVKSWAIDEFTSKHNKAYVDFISQNYTAIARNGKRYLTANSDVINNAFVAHMKQTTDKLSVSRELETYEVKHNIEDNVASEVFCNVHNEEFIKFIEERNANSTTGQLDPNSEIARCYYFAYCKKENPLRIDNFKRYFDKRVKETARTRIEDGTLTKHKDKKVVKISKNAQNNNVESSSKVVANVNSAPVSHETGLAV